MKRIIWSTVHACLLMVWASGALAQEIPTPPFLPATVRAKGWIDTDPSVVRLRNAAEAADHGAAALAASSHEWTLRLQSQRRDYQDSGATSREWQLQLERPIRINGKAGLDRELREVEAQIGQARVGEARHESARALADLWIGAIGAARNLALVQEQLALAKGNLETVEKRKRAGDASALDVNMARAELGDVQREANLVATAARKLETALRVRFGAEVPPGVVLPEPGPPIWPEQTWRARVLEEADTLKASEGESQKARIAAKRVSADRVPDPTLGIYTASEAMRNERVVGLSVSMPLGGSYRNARTLQAQSDAQAAHASTEQVRRETELEAMDTFTEASASLERWRTAKLTAALAAENARLAQRAYALGEADLQSLLLARRQSAQSARAALEAQVDAVKWETRLLIDAHLIWDLAKD